MNPQDERNEAGARTSVPAETLIELVSRNGFILYSRDIAHRLGYKAALLFGHALYWSRYLAHNDPQRRGWFFMTARQWHQATALSKHEQTVAREALKDAGLLAEKLSPRSGHLNYHVNLTGLAGLVGVELTVVNDEPMRWHALESWFHESIAFYRPLVDASGSVSAALYMSYLLRLYRDAARRNELEGAWLTVKQTDVRRALCLGVKSLRNARKKLVTRGLVSESYGRVAIEVEVLESVLIALGGKPQTSTLEHEPVAYTAWQGGLNLDHSAKQGTVAVHRGNSEHNSIAYTRWSADRATETQTEDGVVKKGQIVDTFEGAFFEPSTCPFLTPNLPFFTSPISIGINKTTTTARERSTTSKQKRPAKSTRRRRSLETAKPKLIASGGITVEESSIVASDGAEPKPVLHLPEKLDPSWHNAVLQTVHAAPVERRQLLLDELAGQMSVKDIRNPPGYLHALVQKDGEGTLVLAMASNTARLRSQRKRHAERMRTLMAARNDTSRVAKPAQHPESKKEQSEAARLALEQLRKLRRVMAAGGH